MMVGVRTRREGAACGAFEGAGGAEAGGAPTAGAVAAMR
jgi:hypothetical protein